MHTSLKQRFLILLMFNLIAMAFLSPISATRAIPKTEDYANHLGLIVQAKQAILEGQFPPRVAPWQHGGLRYPVYQFYSPSVYTISGLINCIIINPYKVYQLIMLIAMVLGGLYMAASARLFTGSKEISLLAGVAYMIAPYFIINVDIRGAYTEAFAQGILPITLFYTCSLYLDIENNKLRNFCVTSIAWFLLATSHMITFVYSFIFITAFIALLACKKIRPWENLYMPALALGFSCLLGFWFFMPVYLLESGLNIHQSLVSPYHLSWLTNLSELLSIQSVAPLSHPELLLFPLHPSVGWCMLLGAGYCFYLWSTSTESSLSVGDVSLKIIGCLLIVFFIAFFLTWSPFNFWEFLPKFMSIAQFSYRLLAQVMWIGALLFAFALYYLLQNKVNPSVFILILLLIGLSSSSWLQTNPKSNLSTPDIIKSPNIGYGQNDYLVNLNVIEPAAVSTSKIEKSCKFKGYVLVCEVVANSAATVDLPILYYSKLLYITDNGTRLEYGPSKTKNQLILTQIKVNKGKHIVKAYFRGLIWAK